MNEEFGKYTLSIKQVDNLLKETNPKLSSYTIFFDENLLYDFAIQQKRDDIRKMPIKDWYLFENGEKDLTQEDFFDFFLKGIPDNCSILLFTDEGILNKLAFQFDLKDFFLFSNLYEDFFQMEFFQLSYYCVVFLELSLCKFIDESGVIYEISFLPA